MFSMLILCLPQSSTGWALLELRIRQDGVPAMALAARSRPSLRNLQILLLLKKTGATEVRRLLPIKVELQRVGRDSGAGHQPAKVKRCCHHSAKTKCRPGSTSTSFDELDECLCTRHAMTVLISIWLHISWRSCRRSRSCW